MFFEALPTCSQPSLQDGALQRLLTGRVQTTVFPADKYAGAAGSVNLGSNQGAPILA
jgi:hypothetical protein